jgi:hypothetical protein
MTCTGSRFWDGLGEVSVVGLYYLNLRIERRPGSEVSNRNVRVMR